MKGLPSGAMVEINTDLIGEGDLKREMDRAIVEAHAALIHRRDKEGKTGGACKISVEIEIGYDKDMRDTVAIRHVVTLKTPKNQTVSLVKEKNGRLLCQRGGASKDAPEQQRLFDAAGRPIGAIDKNTGEVIEEQPVAGKIGQQ